MTRRLCLSLAASTVEEARRAAASAPPEIELVELRLDRLDPEARAGSAWESLPAGDGREWVATWRDPAEGGAAPRPAGILDRALRAGFPWIDVEAAALEAGDPEAHAVPTGRRWVSLHPGRAPEDAAAVRRAWSRVAAHPGALHKLVVPAGAFPVNTWVLDLLAAVGGTRPVSIFALGWTGHVSRIRGYLQGNAVTYVAGHSHGGTAPGQPSLEQVLAVYALPGRDPGDALYGVVGRHVRDSGSPTLHNAWFREHRRRAVYVPLETPEVEPVVDWLRAGRLTGCSVTAPFKETVMDSMDALDPAAARLGAVNTIVRDGDGRLRGANTDHAAAVALLDALPEGPVALVGAGGAARAVAWAARDRGRAVTVFNRGEARGRALAEATGASWGGAPGALDPARHAILANATPLGTAFALPPPWTRERLGGTAVLDLAYASRPSDLERLARQTGAPFRGGREFLARQAAAQFALWTGITPAVPAPDAGTASPGGPR